MNNIAVYYDNQIVYWDSVLIVAGLITCFLVSLSLYKRRTKYGYGFCIYAPVAIALSVLLSRILSWYCNMESYGSFMEALRDFSIGGYLIPGVLIAVWIAAIIISFVPTIPGYQYILDSLAPGLAFSIAIIKFSAYYSDSMRGKIVIESKAFQGLPISVAVTDSLGETQYRFATFFISFILMLVVCGVLLWFFYADRNNMKKEPVPKYGHVYRLFLVLYGMVEIVMDSTRYDAAHLYFPGEALADLNKGASFMGLSQSLGAVFCIYAFIYYLVSSIKINKWNIRKHLIAIIVFIVGFAIGGVSEYLVQRYSGMYLLYYSTMTVGVLMIGACVYILYRQCIYSDEEIEALEKNKKEKNDKRKK